MLGLAARELRLWMDGRGIYKHAECAMQGDEDPGADCAWIVEQCAVQGFTPDTNEARRDPAPWFGPLKAGA